MGTKMSITRAPRPESNFYILDKRISEDQRLSWGARGLLIFLLGKPDSWTVSINHLRDETKNSAKPTGRDGVYGLLDELIQAGYVIRSQERQDSGGFSNNAYMVRESPLPDLPYTGLPDTAKPTLVSIDLDQGLNLTNSCHQQADDVPVEEIFNTYEKMLPTKPRVRIRDDARRKAVRSLWRKDPKYQSVDFWEKYFSVVRESDFLMGQKTFAFDWLMKPANFKKVAEGNYSR
jgi:hypothetical protein